MIIKNQRVLTENLKNAEGFEHLFSIAGHVGKVDDLFEKNDQVFIKLKSRKTSHPEPPEDGYYREKKKQNQIS